MLQNFLQHCYNGSTKLFFRSIFKVNFLDTFQQNHSLQSYKSSYIYIVQQEEE